MPDDATPSETTPAEQLVFLAISLSAVTGTLAPRTVRFSGCVQGHSLTILLDSGSSSSFLSELVATRLQNIAVQANPCTVRIAGGGTLPSSATLLSVPWSIGQYTFTSDLCVLPLAAFDMIIGMDWLESFSPMHVHWKHKWLSIPYEGHSVVLKGELTDSSAELLLQVCTMDQLPPDSVPDCLPVEVQPLLEQFSDLFQQPDSLPPSRACNHAIPLLPGAQPFYICPYRYLPALKDEIEHQGVDMLTQGLIQPSTSLFSSPVLLVKKDNSYRFCVDFRKLNSLTVKSKYPVPVIDQLLDELHQASWFSKLDLLAGFHQILLQHGDEHKTAFQTHSGHYEFRVMVFGLTGAPGSFQGAMNHTLAPGLHKFVIVFFDDILVYSKSLAEHLDHLNQVLSWLCRDQRKLKLSKCSFAQHSIAYWGHVLSAEGVSTDPTKVQAIQDRPVPTTARQLRGFLGLAGYYRKFVCNFGVIAHPLTQLLKKDAPFAWTPSQQSAFSTLQLALGSAPVLALPDISQPFHIDTDASGVGIGAVLHQNGHPIAFISKALCPRNRGLSAYEKEYLTILLAVEHWRHYLLQGEFFIHTNHQSLTHLNEQRLNTVWQQKVFTKLLGLNYKIIYKKGADNTVADALSRHDLEESVMTISSASLQWLSVVVNSYSGNPQAEKLLTQLAINPDSLLHFSLLNGIIRYKRRIWLAHDPRLQSLVLSALHSSPLGGHSGVPVTYQKLRQFFFWLGMYSATTEFIRSCDIC